MSEIPKIVKLLSDAELERRLSAAVVLGALKAKGNPVKDGLLQLLEGGGPDERRVALEALGQLQIKATLPALVERLATEQNPAVQPAAETAVVAFAEAAVPVIEKRRERAEPSEKRALDAALARLGGRDAFGALLEGLVGSTPEASREAALRVRQHLKTVGAAERKGALAQLSKFIKRKDVQADKDALMASLKILGYLEDKRALGLLVEHLARESADEGVRMEAIIALRFALGSDRDEPEVAAALLDVVEGASRDLSRAAIDTLQNLDLSASAIPALSRLAADAHPERAQFALDKLRLSGDAAAKKALVKVLLEAPARRAEMAAPALEGEARAVAPLLAALPDLEELSEHAARVVPMMQVLASVAGSLNAAQKKKLVAAAESLVEAGTPGYESVVKVAREADPEGTSAALRELAARLRKRKKDERAAAVLGLLEKGGAATDEDRFRRAMLELKKSRKDTKPTSRAKDPALKHFQDLLDDKVDVGALLRKERGLEQEDRFYLGWHFIEEGEPLGEELLDEVIKKAPRTKLARMAKNKLALERESE